MTKLATEERVEHTPAIAFMSAVTNLAMSADQVVGEKNEYYVTLSQVHQNPRCSLPGWCEMNCPTCGRPESGCFCTAINTRKMARDLSAWVFSSALAWSVIWALAVGVKLAWVLIH